jgi:hypothetical protein
MLRIIQWSLAEVDLAKQSHFSLPVYPMDDLVSKVLSEPQGYGYIRKSEGAYRSART